MGFGFEIIGFRGVNQWVLMELSFKRGGGWRLVNERHVQMLVVENMRNLIRIC